MKLASLFAASALALVASAAGAATIDFEATPTGTYSSLAIGDVTFTFTGGNGDFDVVDSGDPGAPIAGHALISFFQNPGAEPFMATFANGASAFTIGVGDFGADEDNDYLEAYDASGNLLDSDYYFNPAGNYGGGYLTVSSDVTIAYVKFWDAEPYPGAVYWDNASYTPVVPEPETYALMGLGLAAVGFMARRRRPA